MKVMNEVTTDVTRQVTEILVEHGDNVEYDQLLVRAIEEFNDVSMFDCK